MLLQVQAQTQTAVRNDMKELKTEKKNMHQQSTMVRKEMRADQKELKSLDGNDVSVQTKDAFYVDFGGIKPTGYLRTTLYDKVYFVQDGMACTAFYDSYGQLVGTTKQRTYTDLPEKGKTYITTHYPGYKMESIIQYDDNENNETDMQMYNQQFAAKDCYFVEMRKDGAAMVLQVFTDGDVGFYQKLH